MSYHIFSGSSHPQFAKKVSENLGVSLGKVSIETFPDHETGVQILEPVLRKDVFLLQSIAKNPDHYLIELLFMIDACKRAGAKSITTILPYFGYARQDRISKEGEPISAKIVSKMIENVGSTNIITMDLHSAQIEGFFDTPFFHLHARPIFIKEIKKMKYKNTIIVSPDIGSNQLARKFAKDLKYDLAIVDKKRVSKEEVAVLALIGDVSGKEVIIVDDMLSTGNTVLAAAKICKERGAKKIIVAITHGLFSNKFFDNKLIDHYFITDTIPFDEKIENLQVLSVTEIFSDMIKKIVQ